MTSEIKKIYEKSLGDMPQAPESVREAYAGLHDAFEKYICQLEEFMFIWAYQLGREAGRKEVNQSAH